MSNDPIIEACTVADQRVMLAAKAALRQSVPAEGGVFIPQAHIDILADYLAASDNAYEALRMSVVPAWGAINRKSVESSNVASVGYHIESNTLEVEFKSGTVYRYLGVDCMTHKALTEAPSVGKFLNERIKPVFRVEKQPAEAVA